MSFYCTQPDGADELFCHVRADGVELVGPTQTPGRARTAVAELLKIPEDKITVEMTRLGGGFGRRLKFDYVLEAAELSKHYSRNRLK